MKKVFKLFSSTLGLLLLVLILIYSFAPGVIVDASTSLALSGGKVKEKTIEIDGQPYAYLDNEHAGKEILILVHGYCDGKESWFPFANAFTKDYHIISVDLLGHGANKKDPELDYSFKSQAEFLKAFTTHLSLKDFHLIGASMGGGVASKFVSLFPNEAKSLILISSAGINGHTNPSKLEQYMEKYTTTEDKEHFVPILPNDLSKASLALFKEHLFYKKMFIPHNLFKYHIKHTVIDKDFHLGVMHDFIDPDTGDFIDALDDELNEITCPVLVLWGKQDPLLDASSAQVFQDSLPNQPIVKIIDNCGHAPTFEQVEITRNEIANFLSSL